MSQTMSSRSPEAEPSKASSKRKGTRSVSTLTPSQLARKRANDREAQRAIRARTKEHIERLERELEEYKAHRSRDQEIQKLKRENLFLRNELEKLQRGIMRGVPPTSSYPQPQTGYDIEAIAPAGSAVSSRASSFGNGAGEYNTTPGFPPSSFLPTPEPCETPWPSALPVSGIAVPSVVSSPCSSTGHPEDYVAGYIPTSVPAGISVVQPPNMTCLEVKPEVEYGEEIDANTDHGLPHSSSTGYLQQQSWASVYPGTSFYSNAPTI